MSPRRLLAPLVLAAVAACDGASDLPLQTRENAFRWTGRVPAGQSVFIRDLNGNVDVAPSPDDSVRVSARIVWRKGDPDRELQISGAIVPEGALLCALTRNGTCAVGELEGKKDLSTDTDARVHLTVAVPTGVRVDVVGLNGDMTVAAAAPVAVRSLNGDVMVATAVGPVRAETLNGNIDLRMSSLTGTDSVVAKTLNGNVYVYLTELTDAVVDLEAKIGRVGSDFPLTVAGEVRDKTLRSTVGAGSRVIHLRSVTGDAFIRRLDASGRAP